MESQTVLLIDDEEAVREAAVEYLLERGLNVITANSATEAIQWMARPDHPIVAVLVTDFVMPDMNGMDLSLHLNEIFPDLQTLFITGFGHNVVVNGELASENAQWLSKPVSLRVLDAEVRKMLARTAGTPILVS